jgi:hypothetical protein
MKYVNVYMAFIEMELTLVLRETNLSSEHNFWHGRRVRFNIKTRFSSVREKPGIYGYMATGTYPLYFVFSFRI